MSTATVILGMTKFSKNLAVIQGFPLYNIYDKYTFEFPKDLISMGI